MTRSGTAQGAVAIWRLHNARVTETTRSLPLPVPYRSIRRHDLALHLLFADLVAQAMIVSRADEAGKKRVGRQWLRFQFGVGLSAQEPGVVSKLDHLDEFSVRRIT